MINNENDYRLAYIAATRTEKSIVIDALPATDWPPESFDYPIEGLES